MRGVFGSVGRGGPLVQVRDEPEVERIDSLTPFIVPDGKHRGKFAVRWTTRCVRRV